MFDLKSSYTTTDAQKNAIEKLAQGVINGQKHQALVGVTGSGKTFVAANIIQKLQKSTLIISHNKTLAGQLYQEFRDFFPNNAVEYFVSYYDYYQPESYIPTTDTYIEKDADINEEIDKLRLSATASLLTRKDVIVVASVSCIYNLGSPIEYQKQIIELKQGMKIKIEDIQSRLIQLYYERNDMDFKRGTFRARGDTLDIHPAYQSFAVRLELLQDKLVKISFFDPISGEILNKDQISENSDLTKTQEEFIKNHFTSASSLIIYPAKHYVAPKDMFEVAIKNIKSDLEIQLKVLEDNGKKLEAYRLSQRTKYDLEMIQEIGYCKGIENYSRYFDGREKGTPPYSLLDFFPKDYNLIIDESHITIPQVRGMYNGDQARKQTLVNYGFRLPSALDN
ncbi:excinuclease ABC subunit B, partial [candidate division WWE3 bacterium CG_4_9_14_3_um_filter_34_6]